MTSIIQNIGGGEPGVCQIVWYRDEHGEGCTIKRADPQVWIGKQLLNHLLWEPDLVNPALSLIKPSDGHGSTAHVIGEYEECRDVLAGEVCFVNKLLRIEADNGTVVYRIKRYLSEGGGVWEATLAD
jgi:hypothetical protein